MRVFLISSVLMLSGCAFTDIQVELPSQQESLNFSGGDGREIVLAVPYTDDREIQNRCGMKKNGYNMDTASVMCASPPAKHLAELVAKELKAAGFDVRVHGEPAKVSGVKIQGTLFKFFVEPVIGFTTVSMETDIGVRLVATSSNGLNAERSFFVKGTHSAMVATESKFKSSVDDATKQIVNQMVSAIITLMNRYPELGLLNPIDMLPHAYL